MRSAVALVVAGFIGCSIGGGLLYAATKPPLSDRQASAPAAAARPDTAAAERESEVGRTEAARIAEQLRPGPNAVAMLFQQPQLWPTLDNSLPEGGAAGTGLPDAALPGNPIEVGLSQAALPRFDKVLKVERGDTLIQMLTGAGASVSEAHLAVKALSTVYDPRRLKLGQELTLTFDAPPPDEALADEEEGEPKPLLAAVRLDASTIKDVIVQRDGEDFVAQEEMLELTRTQAVANGEIRSSLYVSAERGGVPVDVLRRLVRLFSYDVDFERDLREGDRYMVFFEEDLSPDGDPVRYGEILAASMNVNGRELLYYRFTPPGSDEPDYFSPDGKSVRKALLRTPVDATRISSGFGRRKHPILGYTRMHKGLDFAASTGTPIRAAGDGVVEKAGWFGGYGKYVRIRHNGTYSTAYAHMSRLRVKPGQRVKQGQVIGNVGSTGRSTGPHLHYEVMVKGKQVNPMKVTLPLAKELKGKALAAFLEAKGRIDSQIRVQSEMQTVSLGHAHFGPSRPGDDRLGGETDQH
ncbi:M23 family metallopeptidase [Marinibaculum pumilum]|uniref:M23 family metallopeptidase n=1 Tax=Marinibaculum pumilum TaxID=1766165 RepID=A0ABV7KTG2_9PROT